MTDFFILLFSFTALLPAGALCFFLMGNQLRYSRRTTVLLCLAVCAVTFPAAAWLCLRTGWSKLSVLLPLLAVYYCLFHRLLRVHVSKSLAVYLYFCSLMGQLANIANGFDSILHPYGGADDICLANALIQLGLNTAAALVLARLLRGQGRWIIDSLNIRRVWYVAALVSSLFLAISLRFWPHYYQTLYTNLAGRAFWGVTGMLLVMMLLLLMIFHFIVTGLLSAAETESRNRILEMQESQYLTQQQYMEATAQVRHDFKHTIRTLQGLAHSGDFETLTAYLDLYADTLPESDVRQFCGNPPVNALLNHYAQAARQEGVDLYLQIELPEDTGVSDVDLCSILGNLLENAMEASRELAPEPGWIQLVVTVKNDALLCIAAGNRFSGQVRQRDGRYLSTRRSSDGVGLVSIASTADKYGGSARFYHEKDAFYSDVMIPVPASGK